MGKNTRIRKYGDVMNYTIINEDCNIALDKIKDGSIDMIYIDPPFNTGKTQKRKRTKGKKENKALSALSYEDAYVDYPAFLRPLLRKAYDLLQADGSIFVHLDWRESHYIKILLDEIFGRENFMNEVIWAYDYGGRSKKKWSAKHDTIFWYVKDNKNYTFNFDEMDRIPYMAPGLVGKEKAARGKTPTDVFWHTIVPTNGREKTGYPTQKPLGLLRRFIKVHTNPGDKVLDFFAGSGTTGEAAVELGRKVILVDSNPKACKIMEERLGKYGKNN